jgi:hypothetical protein
MEFATFFFIIETMSHACIAAIIRKLSSLHGKYTSWLASLHIRFDMEISEAQKILFLLTGYVFDWLCFVAIRRVP